MATVTYPVGRGVGVNSRAVVVSSDGSPATNNTPNMAIVVFANTQTVLPPTRSFGTLMG